MDVSKYIGLFLFKNHFCYIHGLGNLELKKIPATLDNGQITAPQYDVILTTFGSIDDNFANFIATIEQVSISKASNSIREFSIETKNAVAAGQEVLVPTLGKFTEINGKVGFITDPHIKYTPPAIPAHQILKRPEEESPKEPIKESASHSSGSSVDWGKIAILASILIVIILAAVFGIRYLTKQSQNLAPVDTVQATIVPLDTVKKVEIPAPVDDSTVADGNLSGTTTIPAENGMISYKVLISTYDNLMKARKRYNFFTKDLGINVEMATNDSVHYVILMPFTSLPTDTTRILDSLKKTYNPSGVSIYK